MNDQRGGATPLAVESSADGRIPVSLSATQISAIDHAPFVQRKSLSDSRRAQLTAAADEGRAIWIQLRLESDDLEDHVQQWLEGSLDVWRSIDNPEASWAGLAWLSELIRYPDGDHDEERAKLSNRLLALLPQLYGRGIFRAARDAFAEHSIPAYIRLFPTVGFAPAQLGATNDDADRAEALHPEELLPEPGEESPGSPAFWAIRCAIAVVGNLVVSVRLPDLLCSGRLAREVDSREGNYQAHASELMVPVRFFARANPDAYEIAEGIAHHQAATARSASETLRHRLAQIEKRASQDDGSRHEQRQRAHNEHEEILDMVATVDELDRQVSRLLRRFGSFGDDTPDLSSSLAIGARLVPQEASLRYRYALDEIRSLREDCQRAADAINARIAASDQDDRNRFELAGAFLATVILTPTLVAGLYGANVRFPGVDSGRGAVALLLAIFAFVAAGLFVVSVTWVHDWRRFTDRVTTGRFRNSMVAAGGVFSIAAILVSLKVL